MSTTYGATGLGQTAASTRRVSSFFNRYWGALLERRERQRVRTALCDLSDWELKDIGTTRGEIDTLPRTELPTREASDPPNGVRYLPTVDGRKGTRLDAPLP